ncbi:hypothetical protein A2U01_0107085, partial [Trifolium medium]|nr:hypothetical protein [Trifolium medium]
QKCLLKQVLRLVQASLRLAQLAASKTCFLTSFDRDFKAYPTMRIVSKAQLMWDFLT